MRALVQRISNSHKYAKALEWGRFISFTGLAQIVIQCIGFLSGILVIRLLPTQEYAFYTLANTMLGTMTILADGGIASGITKQGGKVWQNRENLGKVLATGLKLRRKFAIGSFLISAPFLLYLLRLHGASWLFSILILFSLVPAFLSALSGTLLEIPAKLKQDIIPLQKIQIGINLRRMIVLLAIIFFFPYSFVAIFSSGFSQIWGNIQLRKLSSQYADWRQKSDISIQIKIIEIVKRILPVSIYYCISGQLTIWIISILGSTLALSQIGALSRFSVIFIFFSSVFSTLIVPRFARLNGSPKNLIKLFLLTQGGLILLSCVIISIFYLFPAKILWILGKDFSGLTNELLLVAIGGCISLISISTNRLLSSRGIIVPPLIFIICAIFVQVVLAIALPINELVGILLYGIYTTFAIYLIRLFYLILTIYKNEFI